MAVATINTDHFYTTAEAAEKLGVDVDTVRKYCANYFDSRTPAIEAVQAGRSWLIHHRTLTRFMKDRKGRGRPKAG